MNIEAHKITCRTNGEYSTTVIPLGYGGNGFIIETCWFPSEGGAIVIGRELVSLAEIADRHIAEHEAR